MFKQIFIRPSSVFLMVWLIAILSYFVLPDGLRVDLNYLVLLILATLYFVFLILEAVAIFLNRRESSATAYNSSTYSLNNIFRLALYIWIPLYLINIFFSGGIPIYWQLNGDERSYGDFGIPTFTGMVACLRLILVVIFIAKDNRNSFDWVMLFVVFSSVIAELSRGNAFLLAITFTFSILFFNTFKVRHFFYYSVGLLLAIIGFAGMGVLRYNNLYDDVLTFTALQLDLDPSSNFLLFEMGLAMVTRYLGTPINNVFYAFNSGFESLYYPFFSIMYIVPTFVREQLFTEKLFPLPLYNEAYNTGSFLSIFLADFGTLFTILIMVLFFSIISYSYSKALKGDLFHKLLMPLHFSVIALSIFSNYFVVLQYLFYPLFLQFFLKLYK